jgi:glycosyltransferase 2 family protein
MPTLYVFAAREELGGNVCARCGLVYLLIPRFKAGACTFKKGYNPQMRKFFTALALLLGIIFVIGKLSEVHAIIATMQSGDWRYLTLAFAIQGIWLGNVALSYWAIFRLLNLEENPLTLFNLSAAANFINVVAPTAGMGGMAVFVGQSKKAGYSPARATIAGALYVLFDYLGFICVLALGIFVLFRRDHLTWVDIVASVILVIIASGLAILLYLGTRSENALGRTLAQFARWVNFGSRAILKRDYLSIKRAYEFAHDAVEGLSEITTRPSNLVIPALLALSNKLLLIMVFTLVFLAFGIPFTMGTIIAGFSIGYLFMIVSPTPSGIGVVEGILTITLHSLSVSLAAAAVVALTYRGITFWFPLFIGMFTLQTVGADRDIDTSKEYV